MTSARDLALCVMYDAWDERLGLAENLERALDALLAATQEQTCSTCGGDPTLGGPGLFDHRFVEGSFVQKNCAFRHHERNGGGLCGGTREDHRCPSCSDGVVPGTEPLVLLGLERMDTEELAAKLGKAVGEDEDWTNKSRFAVNIVRDELEASAPLYRHAGSPDA